MNLLTALSLLGVMVALAAMPSASVALVVTRSATLGFANGVAVALGIVFGDLLFVCLAILGLSVLAETLGSFFYILKVAGGAYLIWLGINLVRRKHNVDLMEAGSSRKSLLASCMAGFVLTLGDVKAIFFYASLFPAFVDLASLGRPDTVVIVLVTVVAVGGVKVAYALVAERIVQRFQNEKTQNRARATAGCVLAGTGAYLITNP